jgi:hypothetical protein
MQIFDDQFAGYVLHHNVVLWWSEYIRDVVVRLQVDTQVAWSRYSEFRDYGTSGGERGPEWIWDVEVGWQSKLNVSCSKSDSQVKYSQPVNDYQLGILAVTQIWWWVVLYVVWSEVTCFTVQVYSHEKAVQEYNNRCHDFRKVNWLWIHAKLQHIISYLWYVTRIIKTIICAVKQSAWATDAHRLNMVDLQV